MKKSISTLEDALAFELQTSYNGEQILRDGIQACVQELNSASLKTILGKYAESANHKLLKVERMLSYLLQEPEIKRNEVIGKLLEETQCAESGCSCKVSDILLTSSFRQIIQYKISVYKTALMLAMELELEVVSDLLHQVLEWERKTDKVLKELELEALKRDEAFTS